MTDVRPIGFWLKLVDRLIDEQFGTTLEEHGVTRRQWQLLNVLSRGPSNVDELDAAVAPFLNTDDSESSADHLVELIESEWVAEQPEGFGLTERGSVAFSRLTEVVAEQRTLMTQGVSETEYEQTIAVLERIARNLGYAE